MKMKSIGHPKTLPQAPQRRRRIEPARKLEHKLFIRFGGPWSFRFTRIAISPPLSVAKDRKQYSIMEQMRADDASLKVSPFHSQIFLHVLRFDQLYVFVSLFSSKSNFLSNDVGCENILTGRE